MKFEKYVEVHTKTGEVHEGILMKTSGSDLISLKLNSGYNLNLDKKNVKDIKKIKKKINSTRLLVKKEKIEFDEKKKIITLMHTGGTVASKVNYETGAVSPSFNPDELLMMYPEIKDIANIKSRLVGNMFSEDMRFGHYNKLAKEIEKELKNSDGIILTHGTDTLAHTSAALSFALEDLSKPVIIVGAQRSSDRPSSDSAMNLSCAANFIAKTDFSGVCVCMHTYSDDETCDILPGCKVKKLHTSRRDAFKAVNGNPIARINKDGRINLFHTLSKRGGNLKLRLFKENIKVGVLKSHPNLFSDEIKMFSKFDGLIIEGTGLGHFSVGHGDNLTKENEKILNELKKLSKKIPIVIVSQCVFGRVNLNVYDNGKLIKEAGVLGDNNDMTFETAFIKLGWLLSNYKGRKDIESLMAKDLRGEISKRVIFERKFI